MKPYLLFFFLLPGLSLVPLQAQVPSIPGVPEPGMTIWGTVTNSANGQAIAITSANWTLSDNAAPVTSFVMTSTPPAGSVAKPFVRIVTQGAQTYYVMQVPFDTRTLGAGAATVNLADPNLQPDIALRHPSFPMKAAAPTYTMTPTINGLMANVKSVDGVNAGGNPSAFTTPGLSNPGFTFSERARIVRVDLMITQNVDPYDTWVIGFFGSATGEGARTNDADGDGQTNEQEYGAGTLPNDATSVLRILTLTRTSGGQTTIGWKSVNGKTYQIESSTNLLGPWVPVGGTVPSQGIFTFNPSAIPATPSDPGRYYRVRALP